MTAGFDAAYVTAPPLEDRAVRMVSRVAGPMLLGLAYVAVGAWWF